MKWRFIPLVLLKGLSRYFRLKVKGIQNIPRKGPCVVVANHSGFSGFDALLLYYVIFRDRKRIPRVMAHKFWFKSPVTRRWMRFFGFYEAKINTGIELLKRNQILVIFPEGENGNFKSSRKMYELQKFKTGAVRLAIQAGAPLIPVLIQGAEESSINLKKIKLPKFLNSMLLPLPLNLIPLPVQWKIHVLPKIDFPYDISEFQNFDLVSELTEELQEQMQESLINLLA